MLNESFTVHCPYDRGVLAKLKPLIAEKAKKRMLSGKADPGQKSDQGKTFDQLAKIAGISHDTYTNAVYSSQRGCLLRNGEIPSNG